MEPITAIGLAVCISLAALASHVRSCITTTYSEAAGPAFWKLLALDAFIYTTYTVTGVMIAILTFALPVFAGYSDYAVLASIFVGVSFREILPMITGSIGRMVRNRLGSLEKIK